MPRTCTICTHPERAAIDKALIAGEPVRTIASRYVTISHMAVQRHKEEHLPATMLKAKETEDIGHAIDVVKQLKAINGVALEIMAAARQRGDGDTALKAIDRVQRQIELQAKLLGELDDRPQIDIVLTPEWLTARATLLAALAPYPEARVAVAERLLTLEASTGAPNGHRG
jgi:hypothetical protein